MRKASKVVIRVSNDLILYSMKLYARTLMVILFLTAQRVLNYYRGPGFLAV
jgi:hypothetical protein